MNSANGLWFKLVQKQLISDLCLTGKKRQLLAGFNTSCSASNKETCNPDASGLSEVFRRENVQHYFKNFDLIDLITYPK